MENKDYVKKWRENTKTKGLKAVQLYLDDETLNQYKKWSENSDKSKNRLLRESIERRVEMAQIISECQNIVKEVKDRCREVGMISMKNEFKQDLEPDDKPSKSYPQDRVDTIHDILSEMKQQLIPVYSDQSIKDDLERVSPEDSGILRNLQKIDE